MSNFKDITGQRFGRLIAVCPIGKRKNGQYHLVEWLCQCDCGQERIAIGRNLRLRRTISCGCAKQGTGNSNYRHGYAHKGRVHPLFKVWAAMLQRCNNPNNADYPLYGKRGITVCERWHDFANFIKDVGERPPGTSIDRINNEGIYAPDNFRWATPKEQRANQRPRSTQAL